MEASACVFRSDVGLVHWADTDLAFTGTEEGGGGGGGGRLSPYHLYGSWCLSFTLS